MAAASKLGGAKVRLADGTRLEIICDTIDGFLNPHDEYLCVGGLKLLPSFYRIR
jgi:hypothetical protein